jgi:hypothetical protein
MDKGCFFMVGNFGFHMLIAALRPGGCIEERPARKTPQSRKKGKRSACPAILILKETACHQVEPQEMGRSAP